MRDHRAACFDRGGRPDHPPLPGRRDRGTGLRATGRAGKGRLWSLRSVLRRVERLALIEDEIAAAEAEEPNA